MINQSLNDSHKKQKCICLRSCMDTQTWLPLCLQFPEGFKWQRFQAQIAKPSYRARLEAELQKRARFPKMKLADWKLSRKLPEKNLHPLSQRLGFIGIMEAQLWPHLTPQNDWSMMVQGVSEESSNGPHDAERHQSLGRLMDIFLPVWPLSRNFANGTTHIHWRKFCPKYYTFEGFFDVINSKNCHIPTCIYLTQNKLAEY